jgi:hypothetical protein
MQTQVVHQRKQSLPWIPMIVAALLVAATAFGVQSALRDRGTTVGPAPVVVDTSVNGIAGPTHGMHRPADVKSGGATGSSGLGEAAVDVHAREWTAPQATGRDPALKATITRIEQAR